MALSPGTTSQIEQAAAGDMAGSKLMQFLNESNQSGEDFVGRLYSEWTCILQSNKITMNVRRRCDAWFKKCCDCRIENKRLGELELIKIKEEKIDRLYAEFVEMVNDQVEELRPQPERLIEVMDLRAAIKDCDPNTWVENCFSCMAEEHQLLRHYAKTPEAMELDTASLGEVETAYTRCDEQVKLLGVELSSLEIEITKLQELSNDRHKQQQSLDGLKLIEEHTKKSIRSASIADLEQSLIHLEASLNKHAQIIHSTHQMVCVQFSTLHASVEDLVQRLHQELESWRRQHTLAYVELQSRGNLEHVASWCAKTGSILYDVIRNTHLLRWENLLRFDDHLEAMYKAMYNDLVVQFDNTFYEFLQKTFVVTEQGGCILKTDKKTWPKVIVRILGADSISILEKKVKVQCCFVNEEDINACCHNNDLDIANLKRKQHKLKNNETNFAKSSKARERQFIGEFKTLQIQTKIERAGTQKQVHEEKYRLIFTTNIDDRTIWTMSLPLVVNTGANQGCHCLASVMWQCYSTDVYSLPLESKERLPWSEVSGMLQAKMGNLCSERKLTEDNLRHLKMRLLGSDSQDDSDDVEVTLKQFCLEKLDKVGDKDNKKCEFSFWKWFLACYNLIDRYLKEYWRNGLIEGFLSKADAGRQLEQNGSQKTGLFLLRFSDSYITDSQGISSVFGVLSSAVLIMKLDAERQKVRMIHHFNVGQHSELKDKNLSNILCETRDKNQRQLYQYHYPNRRKREDVFDKFCKSNVIVDGYQAVTEAYIVDIEQALANCKIEVPTGKHVACEMSSAGFLENKRIKSSSENGKPSCQRGEKRVLRSSSDDHPILSGMLNRSPQVANPLADQPLPDTSVMQVNARQTIQPLSPQHQVSAATLPPLSGDGLHTELQQQQLQQQQLQQQQLQQQQLQQQQQQQQFRTIRTEDIEETSPTSDYANIANNGHTELPGISVFQQPWMGQPASLPNNDRAYENVSPANDISMVSSSTNGNVLPVSISDNHFLIPLANIIPAANQQQVSHPITSQYNYSLGNPGAIPTTVSTIQPGNPLVSQQQYQPVAVTQQQAHIYTEQQVYTQNAQSHGNTGSFINNLQGDSSNTKKNILEEFGSWLDNDCPPGHMIVIQQALKQACQNISLQNQTMVPEEEIVPEQEGHDTENIVTSSGSMSMSSLQVEDAEFAEATAMTSGDVIANMNILENSGL